MEASVRGPRPSGKMSSGGRGLAAPPAARAHRSKWRTPAPGSRTSSGRRAQVSRLPAPDAAPAPRPAGKGSLLASGGLRNGGAARTRRGDSRHVPFLLRSISISTAAWSSRWNRFLIFQCAPARSGAVPGPGLWARGPREGRARRPPGASWRWGGRRARPGAMSSPCQATRDRQQAPPLVGTFS